MVAQVARQPDRPALEFEGRPWSCRELNQRINRLAQALRAACEGQIARCKLPKAVRFIGLDEFPRSTTGNVKRRELEARLDIITLTGATS